MINWSTSDIAGIEFGDSHITAVQLRGKGASSYSLTHAGSVEYDPSAPPRAIADTIKILWKKSRMPTRTVCASLRSASLVMRYFNMPLMSMAELKSALQLKAEEALQLSRDEIAMEWHVNKPSPEKPGEAICGLLAAAPAKDVDRELDVLCAAGLDPVILEIRALGVVNLYHALKEDDDGESMCLVNMLPHAADVMIRRKSGELYPHAVYCRACTLEESPAFLAENIRDVLRYTEYKLGWEPVRSVVLTGLVPGGDQFSAKIHAALGLAVERWDPLSAIRRKSRAVKALMETESARDGFLVSALGLALRRG